jgi:hypothetical protein
MQYAYKCTIFELVNRSIISPQEKITDVIQFFSQWVSVYQTFLVSDGMVQYFWKSLASKSGLLNLRSAKW